MENKDCFAYNTKKHNHCNALNVEDCENCKFYQNKEVYRDRLVKLKKRLFDISAYDSYSKMKPYEIK